MSWLSPAKSVMVIVTRLTKPDKLTEVAEPTTQTTAT